MNASTAVRTVVRRAAAVLTLALLAPLAAHAAGAGRAERISPDIAKGRAIANQMCIACHTVDGTRGLPGNPILAAQHPEYMVRQLRDYRDGRRVNPIMQAFAAQLSDEDMINVAAFYASLPPVRGVATDPELVRLGKRIWRGGIPGINVPSCAACHGAAGAGIPAQYPRLAGQHAEVTATALRAFRSGERANNQTMMDISKRLSDREIAALADFIAGLR
jgi:cytochrome c553